MNKLDRILWYNFMFFILCMTLIVTCVLLGGCSNSRFELDLTERKLSTERWNSDLDIGKIEYIEKANGDTHITVTSYKQAQIEMPLRIIQAVAAMYGGDVLGVAGAIEAALGGEQ